MGEGVREAGRRLNDKKVSAHNEGPRNRMMEGEEKEREIRGAKENRNRGR